MPHRDDETLIRRQSAHPRQGGNIGPLAWTGSILLLLVLAMAGANGYRDLERGLERDAALLSEIRETEDRIAELSRYLADLKDSPKVLERLARQELGLVAADDVVIILPDSLRLPMSERSGSGYAPSTGRTGPGKTATGEAVDEVSSSESAPPETSASPTRRSTVE
jgi:cell division protein FtsB